MIKLVKKIIKHWQDKFTSTLQKILSCDNILDAKMF